MMTYERFREIGREEGVLEQVFEPLWQAQHKVRPEAFYKLSDRAQDELIRAHFRATKDWLNEAARQGRL